MKTTSKTILATVAIAALAFTSSALASGWGWDRDAGAKARGEIGGTPSSSRTSRYYYSEVGEVAEPSFAYRSFSYEPAAPSPAVADCSPPARAFQPGDAVRVSAPSAALRIGSQVVGTVAPGQQLTVSEVRGPWLGTTVTGPEGRSASGWILATEVTLAK